MNEAGSHDDLSRQPAPMEGHGAYNRNSRVQDAGLSPGLPLLQEAAASVPLPKAPAPIVICDYGASEGKNSFAPVGLATRIVRSRVSPATPISVIHTDLPGNDFSSLFKALREDPESYQANDGHVFAFAVGRSFYEQILPPASVLLGWSSWAVQWLTSAPATIPDHVQIGCSNDVAARRVFADVAAADWRTFLSCRSAEMMVGAQLVIVTMASHDDGAFGYGSVLDAMMKGLEDLVATGLVTSAEVTRMVIPTYARTRREIEAPFASGICAGLRLERLELFQGADPIWEAFEANKDADAYGKAWAAFSRSSVFPSLAGALIPNDPQRVRRFLDRLEDAMTRHLARCPERMDIPLARLSLVKTGP